jgi:copper chaperone
MQKAEYDVSGVLNSQRKTQLKNALDKIKGVQEVGVRMEKSRVEVEYNEPAEETEIKRVIESTGLKIT